MSATMSTSGIASTSDSDAQAGIQSRKPSGEVIVQAGEVIIYDAEAKPILFKSLYNTDGQSKRVMIIFIRHFFCGICQEYLKALADGISPSSLPKGVSIVVIGHGASSLISSYVENLGLKQPFPFPLYADQSKKLYDLFEMQSGLTLPPTPSAYFQRSLFAVVARSGVQILQRILHGDAGSGGSISQNGGEVLYEAEGNSIRVPWIHRMMNVEDHAEIDELRALLKLNEGAMTAA